MLYSPDRDGVDLDLDEVFSDPAFTPLKGRCAAFAVVRPAEPSVVWANTAAMRHWGVADADGLSLALFGSKGRGGGWLDGLLQGLVPGRAPRLARGGLARGFRMRAQTAMVRAFAGADGDMLVGVAVPDAAASDDAAADDWRCPGWPAAISAPRTPETGAHLLAEEADAGLARRSHVAVLRDRLSLAFDGAASVRLLWRTDAAGAATRIDADTFSRLLSPMRFDQRAFPEVVADFDPAGAEQLRLALASRATWSGIALDLPVAAKAARVPMVLSGSPIFEPGRLFAGFRGFGTIDFGQLDLVPPRAEGMRPVPEADAPPPAKPETQNAPADPSEPAPAEPSVTQPAPVQPDRAASEPVQVPPEDAVPPPTSNEAELAALVSANVVQLRAFQALAPSRPVSAPGQGVPVEPDVPQPAPAEPVAVETFPAETQAPLTDELAFLALGEALRARIGAPLRFADAAAPEAPEGSRDVPSPSPAPAPVADAPLTKAGPDPRAQLLDALPLALIVMVADVPALANAAAAARLGYPTWEDLARVGEDLVVSVSPDATEALLRGPDREAVPVALRRTAVPWDGAPATLWILGEPDPSPSVSTPGPEAEGRAGELLDRVDDAVALLDGNGLVRRLNRRGEAWFGQEGALGQSFAQLLAPESRQAAVALLGEVRHQRDGLGVPPSSREVLARTGEAAAVPMVLTLGRLGAVGFYLTLRDVTALKRAESERARTERDHAGDAGRLASLLGKVSHEIRTPLNAILGFAEVMMDERFGPLGNPRYRDYLKDIHASGTQVMTLVEDLLDLSRIEAGQLDLAVAALDINRIVSETVAQMQPEAHRERVIMRTSLGSRIPTVFVDERSARQIVRNLLSNAVKFNEPGGQVIVSTAVSDSGSVLLRVRDTGIGMTDHEIAAALEPFGGLPSPHPGNGNGLGLPLTRALVGANGASMAIRSRPREGTLVEVAFTSAVPGDARLPA